MRHRRPRRRRPLRAQHRRRLERGRVRDVRRAAARARGALRLRPGVDRGHQDGLGPERGLRLRRRAHQAEEGPRQAEALWRHTAADHERRLVRRRPGLRACATATPSSPPTSPPRGRASTRPRRWSRTSRTRRAAHRPRDRGATRSAQIICRPTQKEADDYYRYAIIEMADWRSVDRMMAIKNITPQTLGEKAFAEKRNYFASRHRRLSVRRRARPHRRRARRPEPRRHARHRLLDGQLSRRVAAFRDEVLPRLERMGCARSAGSSPGALHALHGGPVGAA